MELHRIIEPDEMGLGRIVHEGKFYGIPIPVLDYIAELEKDTARLDWLEEMANGKDGLMLHDGSKKGRFVGLGLRPGSLIRTLRKAIDDAMG